jgi:N-acetylglucosaminyl-diphospho-decaprenol L-rhamnosyltransferase
MTTSVVVVSHDPGSWLAGCLTSVLGQADEVIVVDNGSPNSTASRVASRAGARPVLSHTNRGFADGVNLGLGVATGDVVALLNDDAVAESNWIAASLAHLQSAGGVAAVVPKLLLAGSYAEIRLDDIPRRVERDHRPLGRRLYSLTVGGVDRLAEAVGPGLHPLETDQQEHRRWRWTTGPEPIYVPLPDGALVPIRFDDVPVESAGVVDLVNNAGSYLSAEGYGGDYGWETPDRGAFDEPRDCFGASGAALVTTADALRRIGPFAGAFFAYYEDTDWSWRAQLLGMRIRYEPSTVVRHRRGATTGGEHNPRVQFFAARNRLLMLARNAPARVVGVQLRATYRNGSWPLVRRSLLKRLPEALVQRRQLARDWCRAPGSVWAQWAGVDEEWPPTGSQAASVDGQRDGR